MGRVDQNELESPKPNHRLQVIAQRSRFGGVAIPPPIHGTNEGVSYD